MFQWKSVTFSIISIFIVEIIAKDREMGTNFPYNNEYGDGYGTEWIYFPDGDDIPHFVNLSINNEEIALLESTGHRGEMQLEFRLYTKDYMDNYISLDTSGNILNDSAINISLSTKPIKIITHGWRSSVDKSCVIKLKNTYLENMPDVNVIALDWASVANNFYIFVAFHTWDVGMKVAELINALTDRHSVSGDQIHLIGHSLGAHIMGVAGHLSNVTVDRITGLDPACPIFKDILSASHVKLDAPDAKYVDIIHTCSGVLGVEDAMGTADFYPNGGFAPQPGCDLSIQNIFEGCSHARSHIFFAESIKNPKAFPTYKCSEWTKDFEEICDKVGYMGEPANVTGQFYLSTNSQEPFGRGV